MQAKKICHKYCGQCNILVELYKLNGWYKVATLHVYDSSELKTATKAGIKTLNQVLQQILKIVSVGSAMISIPHARLFN